MTPRAERIRAVAAVLPTIPIRTVHAFPRVSVADDFRSEFTVRGSPFRHVEVVVDGVATPWLQHTVYGRGATGSLTMLTSHVVEEATLRVGAYPRRVSDRLGAELDMTLRDGSRDRFELRGAIGGTNATLSAKARSDDREAGARLVAGGGSTELPRMAGGRAPSDQNGVRFFRRSGQGGVRRASAAPGWPERARRNVERRRRRERRPSELGNGTNRTTVANVFWRSTLGSSVVLTPACLRRETSLSEQAASQGRMPMAAPTTSSPIVPILRVRMFGGLLEAGAHIERTDVRQRRREFSMA